MYVELALVTSTARLDLIKVNRKQNGIGLERYQPGHSTYKDGGAWQDSTLAHGRRRVQGVRTNVIDAFTLLISYQGAAQVVQAYEDLQAFVENANGYWDNTYQSSPVWLEARVRGESAKRYAIVYDAQLSELPDVYHPPYADTNTRRVTVQGLILGIERSHWQETAPKQGTQIALSSAKYTTAGLDWVHIGNYRNNNGALAEIRTFTTSDSTNLLSGSPPYNLMQATMAVDSVAYFGAPEPFGGLVFDLSQALGSFSHTLVWEYWNGSSWANLEQGTAPGKLYDATVMFEFTGIHSVRWVIPTNWATNSPRAGYGTRYWVRARITAISSPAAVPIQANRHVYALNEVPYVELLGTQTDGDIEALARIRFLIEGIFQDYDPTNSDKELLIGRVWLGLRSYERGTNQFSAWINVQSADNFNGITAALYDGLQSAMPVYANKVRSSTGSVVQYTGGTGDPLDGILRITFDSSQASNYRGKYRLFARAGTTGTLDVTKLRAVVMFDSNISMVRITNDPAVFNRQQSPTIDFWEVIDLGPIQIPPTSVDDPSETLQDVIIEIQAVTSNTGVVEINDLFLLPVDEWAAEVEGNDLLADVNRVIAVDSIYNPREQLRAPILRDGTTIENTFNVHSDREASLRAGARQRLWVLMAKWGNAGSTPLIGQATSPIEMALAVKIERLNRYHFVRS